jgi:hypothetical protein
MKYRDKKGRYLSTKKVEQLARRRALYRLKQEQKKGARGFGEAIARTRVEQIRRERGEAIGRSRVEQIKREREEARRIPPEPVEYEIEIAIDYGEDG